MNKLNLSVLDYFYDKRLQGISMIRLNKCIFYYFMFLDNYDLNIIKKEGVEDIYFKIRNSGKSIHTKRTEWGVVRQILVYVNHTFAYLNTWKLNLKEKNKNKRADLVTIEDINYIVENSHISLEKKVFISILLPSGMRFGEIFTLDKDSFIFDKKQNCYIININYSKTTPRRVVATINVDMITDLLDMGWDGWTFCYNSIRRNLYKYSKKIKKRLYNYVFRKSCISNLSEKNMPTPFIKTYVGWKSLKCLDSYLFISDRKCLNEAVRCGVLENES